MDDASTATGCLFLVLVLIFTFIVNPAAFGGDVYMMFGIDNMSYWEKLVGGLSGLSLPVWFACWAINQHVPTPFFSTNHS